MYIYIYIYICVHKCNTYIHITLYNRCSAYYSQSAAHRSRGPPSSGSRGTRSCGMAACHALSTHHILRSVIHYLCLYFIMVLYYILY